MRFNSNFKVKEMAVLLHSTSFAFLAKALAQDTFRIRCGIFIIILSSLYFVGMASAENGNSANVNLSSPDSKLKIELGHDTAGNLVWSVQRQGELVIETSPLGLTVDGHNLGESVSIGKCVTRRIDETYPTFGNHSVAFDYCN